MKTCVHLQVSCAHAAWSVLNCFLSIFFLLPKMAQGSRKSTLRVIQDNGEFHVLIFDREIRNNATTAIGYVQKSQASHLGNSHPTPTAVSAPAKLGFLVFEGLLFTGALPKTENNRSPIAPGNPTLKTLDMFVPRKVASLKMTK